VRQGRGALLSFFSGRALFLAHGARVAALFIDGAKYDLLIYRPATGFHKGASDD